MKNKINKPIHPKYVYLFINALHPGGGCTIGVDPSLLNDGGGSSRVLLERLIKWACFTLL